MRRRNFLEGSAALAVWAQAKVADKVHLPSGYFISFEGQFQSQQEASRLINSSLHDQPALGPAAGLPGHSDGSDASGLISVLQALSARHPQ